LEGVQTRYKNPQEVLEKIVQADKAEITGLLQKIYQEPVQEDLIAARIRQMKGQRRYGSGQFNSATRGRIWCDRAEAGADGVCRPEHRLTVRPLSSEYQSLDLEKFCREMRIPVIVGNTVGYDVTLESWNAAPLQFS
jgi:IMP dehydrogenase